MGKEYTVKQFRIPTALHERIRAKARAMSRILGRRVTDHEIILRACDEYTKNTEPQATQ